MEGSTTSFPLQAVGQDFDAALSINRDDGPTLSPDGAPPPAAAIDANADADADTDTTAATPQPVKVAIGPQHFDLLKLIGEGAFGKVILVRNRLNKQLYAMKAISKKVLRKKNNMTYMKSERDILTKVNHPFIVTLWFAFQTEARLFLVMDFLSGGELFFHLKRKGLILESEARLYFAEMILAIEFLHGMGVVHRDLKPENVLLHRDGHVCITDFGLAKEVGDSAAVRTLCGTSEYMAPEMLMRNGYTKAVDWWSLGALFFEMLAGKPPFTAKSAKELDKKIISEKASIPSYVTAPAAALLKGMLEKDVNKRLGCVKSTMFNIGGVAGLKAHAFFADLDWHLVLQCHYPPPIVPFPAATTNTSSSSSSSSSSSRNNNAAGSAADDDDAGEGGGLGSSPATPRDKSAAAAWDDGSSELINFHEGFTGQCLSPSVLLDVDTTILNSNSNTAANTTANTPAVSPGGSRSQSRTTNANANTNATGDGGEGAGAEVADDETLFRDFEFVDPRYICTDTQLQAFQSLLTAKLKSSSKKRDHKLKRDEERKVKAAAAAQQQQEEEERLETQRQHQAALKAQRDVEAKARAQQAAELAVIRRKIDDHALHSTEHEKATKRLRNLAKKLKDITDLEAKLGLADADSGSAASPTPALSQEQKLKLRRKPDVMKEMAQEEAAVEALRLLVKWAELTEEERGRLAEADGGSGDNAGGRESEREASARAEEESRTQQAQQDRERERAEWEAAIAADKLRQEAELRAKIEQEREKDEEREKEKERQARQDVNANSSPVNRPTLSSIIPAILEAAAPTARTITENAAKTASSVAAVADTVRDGSAAAIDFANATNATISQPPLSPRASLSVPAITPPLSPQATPSTGGEGADAARAVTSSSSSSSSLLSPSLRPAAAEFVPRWLQKPPAGAPGAAGSPASPTSWPSLAATAQAPKIPVAAAAAAAAASEIAEPSPVSIREEPVPVPLPVVPVPLVQEAETSTPAPVALPPQAAEVSPPQPPVTAAATMPMPKVGSPEVDANSFPALGTGKPSLVKGDTRAPSEAAAASCPAPVVPAPAPAPVVKSWAAIAAKKS